jgi:membrane-associated protease RseP (regulator of RpoE activity)
LRESLDPAAPPEPGDDRPIFIAAPFPQKDRVWLHVLLFVLTLLSTTFVGAIHYWSFRIGFNPANATPVDFGKWSTYLPGLWYSATVLAILGAHEMGHYVACRYYRVEASLPYFIPFALPIAAFQTGTFGAVIRIRQRIPTKAALLDIGLAGPIAGLIVTIPVLMAGMAMSTIEQSPDHLASGMLWLGEPLLYQLAQWLIWGPIPDHMLLNSHPMVTAAWFGLLATALNLLPMGQLDGGHVTYAVLGRRSSLITISTIIVAMGLAISSINWRVWTALMMLMVFLMGPHHPPTLDDDTPLDRKRLVLAGIGLVMLVLCFTPFPISEMTELSR